MSSTLASFTRRRLRLLVLWLLAGVLPLQGMTAAAFTMLGPLHTHEAAPPALRLVDFRRQVRGTAPDARLLEHAATHVATATGHFHGAAEPQRHLHAHDDTSLVVDQADAAALLGLDHDEGRGLSASLATMLAWVPSHPGWAVLAPSEQRVCATLCVPSAGALERLERPPRHG